MSSVQHYTQPDKFCNSCTTFIPLPDSSVTFVTTSYRYPGMGYVFHTCTWRISVTFVQHYSQPDKFSDFCTTFIPLPDSSVTSVTNLIPYRTYPYPTEHNLGTLQLRIIFSSTCPGLQVFEITRGIYNSVLLFVSILY